MMDSFYLTLCWMMRLYDHFYSYGAVVNANNTIPQLHKQVIIEAFSDHCIAMRYKGM